MLQHTHSAWVPTVTCHMSHQMTHRQALLMNHSLQKHTQHLPSPPRSLWDHTRNLHMHPTCCQLHLSVTYKPPPSPPTIPKGLSPKEQKKKIIHSTLFLHNRPVLPKRKSAAAPITAPLPPPSNKASYSVSRDKSPVPTPHALLLPPSVSFHSPCGVSHSGPVLRSHCAPLRLQHTGTISL